MSRPVRLNDVHSRLNPTTVAEVIRPRTVDHIRVTLALAARAGRPVSICGGRHAMGGQQFAAGGVQLDMRDYSRVLGFDRQRATVTVQAGMQWPALVAALRDLQPDPERALTFRQKQTGADRLSLGGALSANVHGRGLRFPPFIGDVESFTLVDAGGDVRTCSRTRHPDLFRLAAGGYGLFGVISEVTLRLVPRRRVERVVEVTTLGAGIDALRLAPGRGFAYGDFQFAIDPCSDGFLHEGVLSMYRPVTDDVALTRHPIALDRSAWERLLRLAHDDKAAAFAAYAQHYLSTSGQVYWADLAQLGTYVDGYHDELDVAASEMITEVFVPPDRLVDLMAACAEDFRRHRADVIYGTVRMIQPDRESFLPWATGERACVIFNLHVRHHGPGLAAARRDFRAIIDRALERGGSYYLTYHRWATREQVLAGHPGIVRFLRAKRGWDPDERFSSAWYRHLRSMFRTDLDTEVS